MSRVEKLKQDIELFEMWLEDLEVENLRRRCKLVAIKTILQVVKGGLENVSHL